MGVFFLLQRGELSDKLTEVRLASHLKLLAQRSALRDLERLRDVCGFHAFDVAGIAQQVVKVNERLVLDLRRIGLPVGSPHCARSTHAEKKARKYNI